MTHKHVGGGDHWRFLSVFLPFALVAYVAVFAMLLGMSINGPQPSTPIVITRIEKVGVPMIPSTCSEALTNADGHVALTVDLNAASQKYIHAVRTHKHKSILKALHALEAAQNDLASVTPTFTSNKESCLTIHDTVDLSLMQGPLNKKEN